MYPHIENFSSLTPTSSSWKEQISAANRNPVLSSREHEEIAEQESHSRLEFEQLIQYLKKKDYNENIVAMERERQFNNLGNRIDSSFHEVHQRINSMNDGSKSQGTHEENVRITKMREASDFAYAQRLHESTNSNYQNDDPYNIHNFNHGINAIDQSSHQGPASSSSSTFSYKTPDTGATTEEAEPIGNLSYLFKKPAQGVNNYDRDIYGNNHGGNYETNDGGKQSNQGLCRLQAPHTLLQSFQKSSRLRTVTTNSHTFTDWYQYMKAMFTSCYLGCLNHMSPHLVPKDKRSWQILESSNECRQACMNSVKQIQEGVIPHAF